MNDVILEISGLSKRFKAVQALTDVSFEVREGESVGLIGPNGSGKTTLFNCVAGYHQPTTGTVRSFGRDVTAMRPQRLAARGVVRTFQHAETFASETVLWNVCTAGRSIRRLSGPRTSELPTDPAEILEICDLADVANVAAGDLSYGQAKRLGVAVGLAVRPRLLMLDEPASGLNDTESLQLARILGDVNRRGVTLLVIDHDMPFLLPIVSRVVVLDAGRKLAEGAPDDVRENREVIDAYLGHGFEPKARSAHTDDPSGRERPGLVASDVRSGYGKSDVLRGVSMEVRPGEAVAVLGANGAGKTTLIRTVSGVLPTRTGEVSVGDTTVGADVRSRKSPVARLLARVLGTGSRTEALSELYDAGLVHVPEGRHIFAGLTVRDNLLAVRPRTGHGASREQLLEQMTELFPILKEKLDLPGDSLSGGQQQMLAIARGLMADPALLCIDEPSLGLAPTMMETLTAQVAAVQEKQHLSVLIVEQSAAMALALSDRVYVMRNGRLVHESASDEITPSELMANYLGA